MRSSFSPSFFGLFEYATTNVETLLPEPVDRRFVPSVEVCPTWDSFRAPLVDLLPTISPLISGCNRQLELTFSDQIQSLIYLHVEEYESGRALLEDLADPHQVPPKGLPPDGIKRSTFFDSLHSRGLSQMVEIFQRLSNKAAKLVTWQYTDLGNLRVIDGTLVDATVSMTWADYTTTSHKVKVHLCFDLNAGIPRKITLTDGKAAERPIADQQIASGQTDIMDRGYQDHQRFDQWCDEGKTFVCRIRGNTQKTIIRQLSIPPKSAIFFYAEVYLGDEHHRTHHPLRLIGLKVRRKAIWIVTNRLDLTALQIAFVYQLRWNIETFFAWWKEYLNVYHLIARSTHGLLMQLLAGLITYLLLVIYFYSKYDDRPSLPLLRRLRRDIRRERALTSIPYGSFSYQAIFLPEPSEPWFNREQLSMIIAIF